MPHVARALACLLLTAPLLASCRLLGGGDDDHLAAALAVVPADADRIFYQDHAAARKRLGLDYLETGKASAEELAAYEDAVSESPGALQTLFTSAVAEMQDAAFSDFDIEWGVTVTDTDAHPTLDLSSTVYRLDDRVDLDGLLDELVGQGFTEDEVGGRRHVSIEQQDLPYEVFAGGLIAGHYPSLLLDATIDTEEHLLIVGDGETEAVLETIDGDRYSAAERGGLAEQLADVDDVEAIVQDRDVECDASRGLREVTPTALEQARQSVAGLARPSELTFVLAGTEPTSSVRLRFEDESTAATDRAAREAYLAEGVRLEDGAPLSTYGTFDLRQDGSSVVVDVQPAELSPYPEYLFRHDGPAACSF